MDLTVVIVQANLIWEDASANRYLLQQHLRSVDVPVDLIVLPEMWSTGFTMQAEALAEPMEGPSMGWMHTIAQERDCAVTGSLIIQEQGRYLNRIICMHPDGTYDTYDKRHLFSMAGEDKHYSCGTERLVWQWKGWRILPQICYDLRFPVFSRNLGDYDIYLNVANWPDKRSHAWRTLLQARAIENQAYAIGVNRVGEDGNGFYYRGDSAIVDPLGEVLTQISHKEGVSIVPLSLDKLQEIRNTLPFLNDRDSFSLEL